MGNHISRIVFQARPQFSIKYEHLPRSCEQKIGNVNNFKTFFDPDTGADTMCPATEPLCQIMFYNPLPTSDIIHKWTLAPEVGGFHIGVLTDVTLRRTPSVRPWNRCVKSCFIINCQLLIPFTSRP